MRGMPPGKDKGQLIRKRHDLNPATNLIVKGAQIVSSRP
jgi:hypothetical protein